MLYRPEHHKANVHPDLNVHFSNVLSRIRVCVYREITVPYIMGLEQHDRVVALIDEIGVQDTAALRDRWLVWKKPGELTVDTILKHLIRDGKLTRYMGGYNGCYASWHYKSNSNHRDTSL